MNSHRFIGVGLLVIAGTLATGKATAETIASPCHANWWEQYPLPDTLDDLPPVPTVPLPVAWSNRAAGAAPDPNGVAAGLEIIVRDADGAVVPGALGVGFTLPFDPPYTVGWSDVLERRLWWRPSAPLTPGAYTASVTVAAPEPNPPYDQCPWGSFEDSLAFVVVAAPTRTPGLETSAAFHWHYEDLRYTTSCDGLGSGDVSACPNTASACCRWSYGPAVELETIVTATGLGGGDGYLYALLIERDPIGTATRGAREAVHPVWADLPTVGAERIYPHDGDGIYDPGVPFPEGSYCVLARLYSLTRGEVVATAQSCANASTLDRTSAPPVCDPGACAVAADPGAEPVADGPVADTPVAEPVADTVGGVADTTAANPVPSSGQKGGCGAGGPAGDGAAAVLTRLAAAALTLRRKRRA